MAVDSTELLHDFSPLIRVYKDGRIERLEGDEFVAASEDPETGIQSKDVVISPEFSVSSRLYLPKNTVRPDHKIPLLVYFHGGAFVIGSAFSPTYQKHLHLLAREANVMIASVDYRLAPENPLPAAYEDSWLALKWIASHSNGDGPEEWLKDYADFDHVYFGGDSAGGNISHNMALKIGVEEGLEGIKLAGIFLNCPYFWGKDPIANEAERKDEKRFLDNLWPFVCPNSRGLDDPSLNPAANSDLSKVGCKQVLIYVGGKDVMKNRGWYYKEALKKSGWEGDAEIVEVEGEEHVFSLSSPTSENSISMLRRLASFLNGKGL